MSHGPGVHHFMGGGGGGEEQSLVEQTEIKDYYKLTKH
jgi:hypothetical protein